MVAAAFCSFYLGTNYVLGSLLLAGVLEQWNVKDSESQRLQRRAIIRKLHNAQVRFCPVHNDQHRWIMRRWFASTHALSKYADNKPTCMLRPGTIC